MSDFARVTENLRFRTIELQLKISTAIEGLKRKRNLTESTLKKQEASIMEIFSEIDQISCLIVDCCIDNDIDTESSVEFDSYMDSEVGFQHEALGEITMIERAIRSGAKFPLVSSQEPSLAPSSLVEQDSHISATPTPKGRCPSLAIENAYQTNVGSRCDQGGEAREETPLLHVIPLQLGKFPPSSEATGFYNPSSLNVNSHPSSSYSQYTDSYHNHRNLPPAEKIPNRDSYSSEGDHKHGQLSCEIYPHNDNHSEDSLKFDVSQDSLTINISDVAAPYSKQLYGAQTVLSKLDSDHGDQKSIDTESHHDYATMCQIWSENMCTSSGIMRSQPTSPSVSKHEAETEVPKQISIQKPQEMHLRQLQKHSHLSISFSLGNVPNCHNISQTLSQTLEDLEVVQINRDSGNRNRYPPPRSPITEDIPPQPPPRPKRDRTKG